MDLRLPVELWRRCAGSGDIPDADLALAVRALYTTDDPEWTRAQSWWHIPGDPDQLDRYATVVLVHTNTLPIGVPIGPSEPKGAVDRLTLHRGRWQRLPDTHYEAALHGKRRAGLGGDAATAKVARAGHPDRRLAGWDVRPLYGLIDIRPYKPLVRSS